jgi:hypothetical protein
MTGLSEVNFRFNPILVAPEPGSINPEPDPDTGVFRPRGDPILDEPRPGSGAFSQTFDWDLI